jgi:hypothetical protein
LTALQRLDGVTFCGENPQIMLMQPDKQTYTAAASYWRSVYSPAGEGNVLLLYLDTTRAAQHQHPTLTIYADNLPLAQFVTQTFNRHLDENISALIPSLLNQPDYFKIPTAAAIIESSATRIITILNCSGRIFASANYSSSPI